MEMDQFAYYVEYGRLVHLDRFLIYKVSHLVSDCYPRFSVWFMDIVFDRPLYVVGCF